MPVTGQANSPVRTGIFWLAAYALLASFYFLALRNPTNGYWYPPIGLGKAAVLLHGPAVLPWIALGELGVMALQYGYIAGAGWVAVLSVAFANFIEAPLCRALLRRVDFRVELCRRRDLGWVALLGCLIPTLAGAVMGTTLLRLLVWEHRDIPQASTVLWWLGDFVTAICWLPAALVWLGRPSQQELGSVRGVRAWELSAACVAGVAACWVAARASFDPAARHDYNLKFICFLPLIWAGIRFGLKGGTLLTVVLTTGWAILYGGKSPVYSHEIGRQIEQVQAFNLAIAVAGLTLGWAIDSMRRAHRLSEEATQRAVEADRAKSQFLAVLSHELRTPLTPALLSASMLANDNALPEEAREQARLIKEQVKIEADLIDDLLDLTRMGRNKLTLSPVTLDLAREVNECVEAWKPEADRAGVSLTCANDVSAPLLVSADRKRLGQVLRNLVSNAIKFTPAGGSVNVRVGRDNAGQAQVKVADNGIGMAPAVLARIFNPFEQAEQSLKRRHGGLGLGLSIARGLVEAHGGTICASSPGEGQGSTFTVTLPLAQSGPAQ